MKINGRYFKKGLCLVIIVLFVGASIIPTAISENEQKTSPEGIMANKWYVKEGGDDSNGGTGWNNAWRNISHAVKHSDAGDKIRVGDGNYYENVIITKTLILEGNRTVEDEGSIINGESVGFLILGDKAEGTRISSFTIIDSIIAGILILDSTYILINHTTIKSNRYGIKAYSSNDFDIIENLIIENKYAFYMETSQDCEINGNHIIGGTFGIDFEECEDFFISNNHLEDIPLEYIFFTHSGKEDVMKIRKNNFINNSENKIIFWIDSKCEWEKNYWRGSGSYRVWGLNHIGQSEIRFPWFQVDDDPSEYEHNIPIP